MTLGSIPWTLAPACWLAMGMLRVTSFSDGRNELHYLVLWTEWPDLKQLYDDRFAMQAERSRLARVWIQKRFAESGMPIFGGG